MKSKSKVATAKSNAVRRSKSVTKRTVKSRSSVLKMLSAMEKTPDTAVDLVQDFLTTGRTGRRNAMPDILGEHAATSVADLPDCMQQLNTSNASTSGPSSSSSSNPFCLQYAPSRPAPPGAPPPDATPPANVTPAADEGTDRPKS